MRRRSVRYDKVSTSGLGTSYDDPLNTDPTRTINIVQFLDPYSSGQLEVQVTNSQNRINILTIGSELERLFFS